MNMLLNECLLAQAKNQGLEQALKAVKCEIERNQNNLNRFVLKYIREYCPERLIGMIAPRDYNKQFIVYNFKNCPFKDAITDKMHAGVISFQYLVDYEYNESNGEVIPDPVYKSGFIYLEELDENL